MSTTTPVFSFGVIADIQYADIDDAMNFSKTEERGYRGASIEAQRAVNDWVAQSPKPLFIAQLGDLIDGQNSGTYGQGLSMESPQSKKACALVMNTLRSSGIPTVHAVGNHELYNFDWDELRILFNESTLGHRISDKEFYFSFTPFDGWTCIMLNPYKISMMQKEDEWGYQEAHRILKRHNKNFQTQGTVNFFEGLEGLEQRFVPFNGGFGEEQLRWLKHTLEAAEKQGNRVMIFTHTPIFEGAASARNLAFDYDRALSVIHNSKAVKVVMAGHYHRGGYAQDECGVHHVTIQSPLTHGHCFALVEVYKDKIECVGRGKQRSYTLSI